MPVPNPFEIAAFHPSFSRHGIKESFIMGNNCFMERNVVGNERFVLARMLDYA